MSVDLRARAAVATLSVLLVTTASLARADDSHYQNFLAGEKAAGMGGAYTAVANDPSGTYYNPAGLVDTNASTLSASLNFYGVQAASLASAFGPGGGDLFDRFGAVVSQINAVPGLAGSINGIGDPRPDGTYDQAWAISVMVLDDTAATQTSSQVIAGQLKSLSTTNLDLTTWFGLGYARRLDHRVSVGASLNAFYRYYSSRQRTISATPPTPGGPIPQTFALDDITLNVSVVGLSLELGVLVQVDPRVWIGASLSTPTLKIYGSGSTDQVQASGAGLTETTFDSLSGNTVFPLHGRIGAAYRYSPFAFFTADVSMWAPVSYQLVSGSTITGAQLADFVNDVQRNFTANVNLGGQWKLFRTLPFRAGLFTNFSSAPQVNSSFEPQLSHINLYGMTLGFTLPAKHTETTVGILFSYGQGTSKPPHNSPDGNLIYQATTSDVLLLNFYVGGSYSF
jgi:long-chain fatty acid transport protein